MKLYTVYSNKGCRHFDERMALHVLNRITYTDKEGMEHHGEKWEIEETEAATKGVALPQGTTKWDVWVALNSFYADTCKVLTPELALKAGIEYFFHDEDAPESKIWRYFAAMEE